MKFKETLINFIYPPTCPLCGDVIAGGRDAVCGECRPMIEYPREPLCLRCGCEITDAEQELCADCSSHTRSYVKGFPAMKYQYPLDESIAAFKYHNEREHAVFYANEIVRRHGKALLGLGIDTMIPIPVHKKKLQKRGYNQAEVLAAALSDRLSIPVETELLVRAVNTEPQKSLDPEHREQNLKKAFQCTKKSVSYKKVLLVDDIYTTGATIEACTKCLHAAGIPEVYYTSVAIGTGA